MDGTELEHHVVRRCRQAGFEPRLAGRLFSHEALLYAIQRGLGVTCSRRSCPMRPAPSRSRSLAPVAHRDLRVLHREEALTRRSVALALDVLVAAARAA